MSERRENASERSSRARLESLLEAIPDGVVLFEANGELLFANRRFAEIYQIDLEKSPCIDAASCREAVLNALDPGAKSGVEATLNSSEGDPGATVETDLKIDGPDARIISLRTTPILDAEGQLLGRLSLHRDVTEKRRWELETLQLADMPNINPFPVFKCDAAGEIRFMNHAAEHLLLGLDVDKAEASQIFPSDYIAQITAVLEDRSGVVGILHEFQDRYLSLTFSPDPRRPECMILVEDVTEHRQADEKVRQYAHELESTNIELRQAQAALVQSEKMASLGTLVAGVAHEINTPVGSINSNGDVMVRALEKLRQILEAAPPEVRNDKQLARTLGVLEGIGKVNQTACERIVRIVRSLRNFARLDEAERKQVNIHEGLDSTLTLVHHELKNRIEVVRDYGEIPEIDCFPNQLNQVFMNMLVNASQAIEGEGKITITTRASGDWITVAFEDTGVGIHPENLQKIFDPGFTTKGVGVGSGLGLAICYKIVNEHGGKIDVESEVGRGTTFTITLPVIALVPPTST
jgi:signal transduction histidine kinase